jgi:hypothetical protein
VDFGSPEVSRSRQSKQLPHCAEPLFDAKALFADQLVKALLRLAWWSTAHRLLQDTLAKLAS